MANKARTSPTQAASNEPNPLDKLQAGYEKNKKKINTLITVVLLAVVGFFAYRNFVVTPKETKANNAIHYAQDYFQKDSVNKALNGDGQHIGFLNIIKRYNGTDAANLSHYYAGICYLKMNDPKNAIKHLEDFDAKGTTLKYTKAGLLGDAYMESGNTKKGIEFYKEAAGDKDNDVLTPIYLLRAGMAYEMNNQPDKAKECYTRIRDEYPSSQQARETEKYLAKLGVLN